MKKTHFKTFLYFEGNKIANEVLIYAALSNAGVKDSSLGINGLYAFAMTLKTLGREDLTMNNDFSQLTQVERIGENTLHIDAKINGQWENVLRVEQIEVWEVQSSNDDEDEKRLQEIRDSFQ